MKNKLERFVSQHRDSFDAESPGVNVWYGVDTSVQNKRKTFLLSSRMRIAASLLVLVNAVVIFVLLQRKPGHNPDTIPAVPVEQSASKSEYNAGQTIEQINKVVEVKQAALKEIKSSNPVLYKKFAAAFSELSTSYKQLEKELGTHPNKEALLEAMIQNLGLQKELLNQQLSIYHKIKQQKNEKSSKNI